MNISNDLINKANKIKINAAGYGVNQVQKVKILDFYIQSNLQNNSQINKIISNINNQLFNILGTVHMHRTTLYLYRRSKQKIIIKIYHCNENSSL